MTTLSGDPGSISGAQFTGLVMELSFSSLPFLPWGTRHLKQPYVGWNTCNDSSFLSFLLPSLLLTPFCRYIHAGTDISRWEIVRVVYMKVAML